MDRSLSETYWLNVNDPSFPFVGIVEHTNFQEVETYGGRHIVYLSKYLPATDPLYRMDADELFGFALPHIQRMFPSFDRSWVYAYHVWSARYSQPVIVRNYTRLIPNMRSPIDGLFLATMAQVYPEDRGTNYAIRDGRNTARALLAYLPGD
jgi:protoporphyrinogen oxidase